jgi:hypothetical protein
MVYNVMNVNNTLFVATDSIVLFVNNMTYVAYVTKANNTHTNLN